MGLDYRGRDSICRFRDEREYFGFWAEVLEFRGLNCRLAESGGGEGTYAWAWGRLVGGERGLRFLGVKRR